MRSWTIDAPSERGRDDSPVDAIAGLEIAAAGLLSVERRNRRTLFRIIGSLPASTFAGRCPQGDLPSIPSAHFNGLRVMRQLGLKFRVARILPIGKVPNAVMQARCDLGGAGLLSARM